MCGWSEVTEAWHFGDTQKQVRRNAVLGGNRFLTNAESGKVFPERRCFSLALARYVPET